MKVPGFTAEMAILKPKFELYTANYQYTDQLEGIYLAGCIHGNYCGPEWLGCLPPEGTPTRDDVDDCCLVHDNCYKARGEFSCSCDRELLECVWQKINPFTPKGRAALAVWYYFSHGWCNPFA